MTPPIHDITNPEEFLFGQPPVWHSPWFWVMTVSACLLIGILILKFTRGENLQKKRQQLLLSASEALIALKQEGASLAPQTLAVRISLILRQYFEAAFDDPSLFETNEELTLRADAMTKVESKYRRRIIDHLHQLSELKYIQADQHNRFEELIERALELLRIIEPAPVGATPDQNDSPSE